MKNSVLNICSLENGKLSKKHLYYYQIQTQLCVCSANHADFVLVTFTDENPNLYHERIKPDEQKIGESIKMLKLFSKFAYYLKS